MIKPIWALAGVALLGSAGVTGALLVVSSGGEEEVAQQVATGTPIASASATPAPSASLAPSPTASPQPTPAGETPVPIPADWQTYDDPKERFTIRIPPNFEYASYSSVDGPAWLEVISTIDNKKISDGAKLEMGIFPKQPADTLESLVQPSDPGPASIRSFDYVTVRGMAGARASSTYTEAFVPTTSVIYGFERGADWIIVMIVASGPNTETYLSQFDSQIIESLIVR